MRRIGATLLGLCACSAPNPLFGLGEPGMGSDGAFDDTGDTGGLSGATDARDLGPGEDWPEGTGLCVFAGLRNNGSIDDDGCEAAADELGATCDALVPLLFAAGTDAGAARTELGERLGEPASSVTTPASVVVADDLDAFVFGPLTTSLFDANVVESDAVWTGLTDTATNNCQNWTSGKDERTAGVADSHRADEGWIADDVASCGARLPVVCLCRTAMAPDE